MIKIINIKMVVLMIGWAKSLTWCVTTKKETRTLYLSIHKLTENESGHNGYGFIVGPLTIMIGYVNASR